MQVRQYDAAGSVNPIDLQYKEIDHVELYVSNARLASHFFRLVLGFQPVAYSGLETGDRDKESIVVKQNGIKLVLTAPLSPESVVAEQVHKRGDGVKDIAFGVADTELAFAAAVDAGAEPVMEPTVIEDERGWLKKAVIGTCGDTVHSLIERDGFADSFLPHYVPIAEPPFTEPVGFQSIDHLALCVESGTLTKWIDFYNRVFGFRQTHREDVITEYTAMNSKVVQNGNGLICFPIMEPEPSKRRSQIEEYLRFHRGPGVQHIAFSCDDIVGLTRHLKSKGLEFLQTPGAYYDALAERVGEFDQDLDELRELGILVDRDKHGILLQIFSRPLHSRPTMFFELIQRQGATGFGGANIKALFEAIEREQARRSDW